MYPLRNHLKVRYPNLSCVFLNEKYDTDTMFESEPELTGYTFAQVYVRMKSNYTYIEGIHTDSEGSSNLKNSIRKVGSTTGIHNYNSNI